MTLYPNFSKQNFNHHQILKQQINQHIMSYEMKNIKKSLKIFHFHTNCQIFTSKKMANKRRPKFLINCQICLIHHLQIEMKIKISHPIEVYSHLIEKIIITIIIM